MTRSFDVFFDLRLNKRLSKQSLGLWFETLSRPLWRYCNDILRPKQNGRHSCRCNFQIHFLEWKCMHFARISLKFVPKDPTNNISASVQLMAWSAPSHYFDQRWLCLLTHRPICVAQPRWVNTLRPRQNGRHFADDTLKAIFLNENIRISIKISLKFVPKVPINNIAALVQIMAWRRPGDKPLSEPMMVCLLTHICVTRPQWVNPRKKRVERHFV